MKVKLFMLTMNWGNGKKPLQVDGLTVRQTLRKTGFTISIVSASLQLLGLGDCHQLPLCMFMK